MGNFKNELKGFESIPRDVVFDKSLSDRARFVYVFMACKPDNWDFYLEPMAKDIGYSVDTLRKYINELVASGWLVKGEQTNENGVFGAVEYTIKATKFTDTENYRHGKNNAQDNKDISLPNTKETNNKEIKKEEKEINKELFEKCWIAYHRKGSKKKAFEYWCKLNDVERKNVLPHIKPYVTSRELKYQKDFERYLRDKIFLDVVISKNNIIYDPTKLGRGETATQVYTPSGNFSIFWDEPSNAYMYIGFYNDGYSIGDGYNDDNRPNGAKLVLNNGRGTIIWSSELKTWIKI